MMMQSKIARGLVVFALAAIGLTGCTAQSATEQPAATGSVSPGAEEQTTAPAGSGSPEPSVGLVLTTAQSEYGEVIADGEGRIVYRFDKDTQGAQSSACEGECIQKWPAVPGDGQVELRGVTGEVGTITGPEGTPQLTLNGWPLYYFAGDETPGDAKGQGLMGVWWVLDPAGEPIQ